MLKKVSAILFFLLLLGLPIYAQVSATVVDKQQINNDAPLTQDEIIGRVKSARAKGLEFDEVATDVDRRGINFVMDENLANQLRFLRATIVTNALWRADDRRKALSIKPKNPQTFEEVSKELQNNSQLPFIEQARIVALKYVESLPNFVVRQQVQRYQRPVGSSWKLGDYLELALSFSTERGEEIKLKLQNGRSATLTLDQIGGLTSTGQFAGQLEMIFNPDSRTIFSEVGSLDFYGQPCKIYSYSVNVKNSHQQLKSGKAQVITGFRGRVYIQAETKQVLRIEEESVDIPYDFPISAAASVVEFGWVTISNKDFLLPVNAQVQLTDKTEHLTVFNCIQFTKYSKFDTDVKILDQ